MLDMSAGLEEVKDLQQQLRGFVSQDQLREVARNQYDYYPIKEAIKVRNDFLDRFEKIEEHLEKVPMSDDTQSTFTDIKTLVEVNFGACVKEEEWSRMNSLFSSDFKELRKFNKSVDKQFLETTGKFAQMAKTMATKVSTKELRDLKGQLDQLPTIPEIREWKKSLKDDIDAFTHDNNVFKLEFEKQNEIIRRYDEVLCQKASHQMMKETQVKIEFDVNKQKEMLLKTVNVIKENMADEVVKILSFQNNIEKEIIRIIEQEKRNEMLRNGGSGSGNDILATDAGRNLKKQLLMKADRLDIEKLFEIKSNVTDTENMIEC